MTLTKKQADLLGEDLDARHVRTRKGGGNMSLSYVDGYYVESRLNEIFGPVGWDQTLLSLQERVPPTEVEGKRGKLWTVGFSAEVELRAEGCVKQDVGWGSGTDKNLGQAYESALKEAVTDGLKRCAKKLGQSMGLALYDKERRHVSVGDKSSAKTPKPTLAALRKALGEATKEEDFLAIQLDAQKMVGTKGLDEFRQEFVAAKKEKLNGSTT